MSEPEIEIVVDDPTAPAEDSPAVTTTRAVEVIVYLLLLALALLLGFDNWRSGIGWARTRMPQQRSASAGENRKICDCYVLAEVGRSGWDQAASSCESGGSGGPA